MRWQKRTHLDSRIVKRFAFFPIEIKGEVRWLEKVYLSQVYVYPGFWENLAFVTKEDMIGGETK